MVYVMHCSEVMPLSARVFLAASGSYAVCLTSLAYGAIQVGMTELATVA